MMKSRIWVYAALMAGVCMLSASGLFAKIGGAPASITAFYRLFFTICVLLPILPASPAAKRELRSATKKQLGAAVLSGFFLAVHYVMWLESLRFTTVSSSTTLAALQALFSAILGWCFLGERIGLRGVLGGLVAIVGTFVVGWGDFRVSGAALWGDSLALVSGALISLFFFFGQICRRTMGTLAFSSLSYSCSVVFLGLYSALTHRSFTGYPAVAWWCFLALTFVSTIGGQMVFTVLMKWITATTVTVGILAEPVCACILAWLFLGETPSSQLCAGIVLILSGLWMFFSGQNRGAEPAKARRG